MAESDLVRPSTSHSGTSGIQRRFLLSSPGRPRTAIGLNDPKFTPTPPAALSVKVTIKFQPSLDLTYERQYQASHDFKPTDQICNALLRRLTHCSNELLTRRDSTALERAIPQIGDGKPLRFELIYQIYRGGPEPWATKSFKSYQKYPLDKSTAMEVARSTDRIVGSFLKLHDTSFRWTHGKMRERSASNLELLKPLSNPVSLLHIPQSRFIDATQNWEFVPGYEITLHFRSRCKSRRQREWERTITLQSTQSTPLTLSHGEDMAWVLSTAMQRSLDFRKMAFDRQHRSCDRFDALEECHHSQQNAVHVSFQIRNQLGLDHRHLRREIDSNLLLFQDPHGLDCEQFVNQLEHAFAAVRDDTDKELTDMDDLRLTVYELSGRGWKAEKPFAVCLDSTACYSRRTIKAVLDRVQTGVADILGGNDMSITLMAHKRGHLVLDKTLVARSPYYATGQRLGEDPDTVKESFLSKLEDRIRSDISMVVKDTCSLSDSEPQNIRVIERPVPAANDPAEMEALPSSSPLSIPTPNGRVPVFFDEPSKPSEPLAQGETLQTDGGVGTMSDGVIGTVGRSQQPETPVKASAKDQFDGHSSLFFSMSEDRDSAYPSSLSSIPSLVDGDIGTPRDSLLVTPTFMKTSSGRPQHFDANPNIADFDTSDSELIEDSVVGDSTPTMARFNGSRQFNLFGKGAASVSRQSLVSTESQPERRSLAESEYTPKFDNAAVRAHDFRSELSSTNPESHLDLPELRQEAAVQESALEGWLTYCCVPVDDKEYTESEYLTEQITPVPETKELLKEGPVIVITREEEQIPPEAISRSLEGFLEYAVVTMDEEDEDESDAEYHDADSIVPAVIVSSPSSFVTAIESGLNSPISLDFAASTNPSMDQISTINLPDILGSASPSAPETTKASVEVEATDTNSAIEEAVPNCGPTAPVVVCTSSPNTAESSSFPYIPETEKPFCELRLDLSADVHRDLPPLALNEAPSISSDVPHTPMSESAPSFSDNDEPREPTTPPLMTETEDSDFSEPSETSEPFPDLVVDTIAHDESKSLALWAPSKIPFVDDTSIDNYFGPNRKVSITPSLYTRPNASMTTLSRSFSHKRQFSSPTAGLFGIHEPRRLDIGLRGALFGLAALRKQGKMGRSNSQVLLKLENNKGMVMVPGSHSNPSSRRNSDARGIGGAGVLGLGSAYAF